MCPNSAVLQVMYVAVLLARWSTLNSTSSWEHADQTEAPHTLSIVNADEVPTTFDEVFEWVLGDRDTGAYLTKFAWTKIVRHVPVRGGASPDDPALTEYWAKRRRKRHSPLDEHTLRLLRTQGGRCPL
jgi:hypothetical protein